MCQNKKSSKLLLLRKNLYRISKNKKYHNYLLLRRYQKFLNNIFQILLQIKLQFYPNQSLRNQPQKKSRKKKFIQSLNQRLLLKSNHVKQKKLKLKKKSRNNLKSYLRNPRSLRLKLTNQNLIYKVLKQSRMKLSNR